MENPFKRAAGPFEWIDLVNPSEDELKTLAAKYKLHPTAIQDVMQDGHLPKYELLDDVHFIISRFYDEKCDKNSDSILSMTNKLSIFYQKDLLITIHQQRNTEFAAVVEKYRNHPNVLDVVCKLIKATFITFEKPTEKLDTEIDFYESRIFLKKRIPDLLKSLYRIKRQSYVMRKLTNLSKDIIDKLAENSGKKNPFMQDLKDHYLKTDTQIEELYENIVSLLNIYISLSSQRTNEVMRTLTVFTAFFLPLTFIVGVYGMNFHFMPELDKTWGYPAVMGLMLGVTIAVWIWFKRKGWM
jgi:magnesium transporter